jgi:putative ABC transport system ATP-binding protein
MIQLEHVTRRFMVGNQEVTALHDLNLSISAGDYVSIMGPSGSGKSTLLNLLGLLDRPSSGVYRLENTDVTALNDVQQARVRSEKIGFVFQSFHLVPRLTAAMNIELPLILAGIPPAQRQARVA